MTNKLFLDGSNGLTRFHQADLNPDVRHLQSFCYPTRYFRERVARLHRSASDPGAQAQGQVEALPHGVFSPSSRDRASVTPAKRGKGAKAKVFEAGQEKTPAERRAAMTGLLLLQNRLTCHRWQ